jgi:hypothetical protein
MLKRKTKKRKIKSPHPIVGANPAVEVTATTGWVGVVGTLSVRMAGGL